MPSDSNYTAVKRFTRRQPLSKVSIPQAIVDTSDINSNQHSNPDNDTDNYDDDYNCWRNWAADTLSDDEIETSRSEAAVAPLLEEGELDADAIVVSPTGNSASAANNGTCVHRACYATAGYCSTKSYREDYGCNHQTSAFILSNFRVPCFRLLFSNSITNKTI
jgi:hypothetical protein